MDWAKRVFQVQFLCRVESILGQIHLSDFRWNGYDKYRNLLSIDSQLNQIGLSTNIIFLPNAEHGYVTKLEILLGGVFQYSIE